ncbi:MAG: Hpt domain-containing protein [Nitrososphaerales archaeon]
MNEEYEGIHNQYKREVKESVDRMIQVCEGLGQVANKEGLTTIIQSSHKIKGVSGMMDYPHISELAEEIELLSKLLLEGKLQLVSETVELLREGINILSKHVETDLEQVDPQILEKIRQLRATV